MKLAAALLPLLALLAQEDPDPLGAAHGRVLVDDRPPSELGVVRAWMECAPREVEIGQPIECTLYVSHPADVTPRVKADELALDDSWIALEEGRVVRVDDPPGRLTRARWVVASLDPGERALELPPARFDAGGVLRAVAAAPLSLRVRPALAEGEDEPRPAQGFRAPPEGGALGLRPLAYAASALLLAALAALLLTLRARRRRRPVEPAARPPLALLAELGQGGLDDPERARRVHFELTSIVRAAADARLGRDLRGLTDEEWLRRARELPGLTAGELGELSELLESCGRVKYQLQQPTRWATEETLGAARALVAGLESEGLESQVPESEGRASEGEVAA